MSGGGDTLPCSLSNNLDTLPPWQTHARENITFPKLRLQEVTIRLCVGFELFVLINPIAILSVDHVYVWQIWNTIST